MIRGLLRLALILLVLGGIVAGTFWVALRPPEPLAVPEAGAILADVTVVNPERGRRERQVVVVRGERVESIEPVREGDPVLGADPAFAGAYVLPGLVDMHVHHPPGRAVLDTQLFGLLFLAHGVTTVRDTGSFDGAIFETRRQIATNAFPGPRIFACGPLLDGDPPVWPQARVVVTKAEADAAVSEIAARGADCVKVYSNLPGDVLAAVRDTAARAKLPVIGHVPLWVRFEDAHLADVQHLTGVPEFAPPWAWPHHRIDDPIAAIAANLLGLEAERIAAVVETSVAQQVAHTPTLVVLEHIARLERYDSARSDPLAGLLPRTYRDLLWRPGVGIGIRHSVEASFHALGEALPKAKLAVAELYRAGVRIHAGSDTMNPFVVPGASLHEELLLLSGSGLGPEGALAAATRVAGESLGIEGLGTVREGAPADLLIFRRDPTEDLANLDTLEAVIAGGRLYRRETLDRAVARYRGHFEQTLYDAASMTLVWLLLRFGAA